MSESSTVTRRVDADAPPATSVRRDRPDLRDVAVWVFLAAISYIPSLLTQPGKIAADTKQYLYLDPGRLIQSAISAWDPDFGAGTVTHENIGFLFPMGPYYWLVAELHIPLWVGQRVLDGVALLRRRDRGVVPRATPRPHPLGPPGRGPGLHAHPVRPRLHHPHLRHRHALGRPRMDAGPDHPGRAQGGVALSGALRRGHRPGRRGQRHVHPAGRAGPPAVGGLRRLGDPRGSVPGGAGCRGPARGPQPGCLGVVDGRLLGRGSLRAQRPQVHRDRPHRVVHLALVGGPARPRLLVLLRPGQAGPLDPGVGRLSAVDAG